MSRIDTGQSMRWPVAWQLANMVQGITTSGSPLKHRQSLFAVPVQSPELSASIAPHGSIFLWLVRSSISRRCLHNQEAPSVSYTTAKETNWSCGWCQKCVAAIPTLLVCCSPSSLVCQDCGKDNLGMCLIQRGSPISCFWTLAQTVANDRRSFVLSIYKQANS